MTMKTAFASLALALAAGGAADAATVTYATAVDVGRAGVAGAGWDGTAVTDSTDRTSPGNALGAPNNGPADKDTTGFLSLGLGGAAVFDFGGWFKAQTTVFEVTFGCTTTCSYVESADIYAFAGPYTPFDGSFGLTELLNLGFVHVGSLSNSQAFSETGGTVSLAGVYRYLALVDTSPGGPKRDGFDVDAISVSLVPLPAGGLLLAGGLGLGLGLLRRRHPRG